MSGNKNNQVKVREKDTASPDLWLLISENVIVHWNRQPPKKTVTVSKISAVHQLYVIVAGHQVSERSETPTARYAASRERVQMACC